MQLTKDFYSEQNENFRQEQIEYFIRILNLFENISNTNENNSNLRENSSFDEIKNEFDQKINYFLNNYKTLLMKNSKDKDKTITNDLSIILIKFQEKFSHLFTNNCDDQTNLLTIENHNSILQNLIRFLNDLYQQINRILYEKKDLNEKFLLLEQKNEKYSKWESKMYQSINEDKHSSLNLKKLANQMIVDNDEYSSLINSQPTISNSSSQYFTIGKNSLRSYSHKVQHMKFQELQISMENEIQARQQIEKQLKQIKSDIIEKNEFVFRNFYFFLIVFS